ncbi:MAG TPA: hypothetical protein VK625_20565 [Flavitalea sp.]|nr:hypothetical protein [Flavitalea sp.]
MKKLVFFQYENDSLPLFLSENIADHLPSLIFVYNARSGGAQCGNLKFTALTGKYSEILEESKVTLESFVHGEDLRRLEELFQAIEGAGPVHGKTFRPAGTVPLSPYRRKCVATK